MSLPEGLDDTYARILEAIYENGNYVPVSKILQLLVCSNEPPTVAEAAEIITVELDSTPQVDLERRLVDPDDLMTMCSALVVLEIQEDSIDGRRAVLRLAHISIREFLLSTRIQRVPVSHWYVDDISSHLYIARLFVAYLLFLDIDIDKCVDHAWPYTQLQSDYPLAAVAASRWPKHLSIAENNDTGLACGEVGSQLFTSHSAAKRSWPLSQTLCCSNRSRLFWDCRSWDDIGIRHGSLVFAAHHNLPQTAGVLLAGGADPNVMFNISHYNDSSTTPLAEASRTGHVNVVKKLLTYQANVENERQGCLNALRQACQGGSTEVVRLLLNHGADPNARLYEWETALGAALIARGSQPLADTSGIVKMLLEAGANIHNRVSDGPLSTYSLIELAVLQSRDISTIKILLDHGADGVDGLVASCELEIPQKVLFFLNYGIDVNARASVPERTETGDEPPFWAGRTVLECACTKNDPAIVRMLLDRGADPNIRSELAASALEACLNRSIGDPECEAVPIFALLLRAGADLGLVRDNKLNKNGKRKYPAVLDRWKAWKVDDSMSPVQIIGQKCYDSCECALVRSELNGQTEASDWGINDWDVVSDRGRCLTCSRHN